MYQCPRCDIRKEIVKPLKDLDHPEFCSQCTTTMSRLITAPAVRGDYAPYTCPITGRLIAGKRQHEENLARHGKRVLEPGETEAYKRSLKQADEDLDRSVEATAEAFVHSLPGDKRESLVKDIQNGADVAFTRS